MSKYCLVLVLLFGCNLENLVAQEWVPLFDGKSLEGWTQKGGKAKYEVKEGIIVGTTVPNTPNSFLCTEKMYGDFELELEFRVDPQLNSGVQIRSNSLEEYKKGRVHGYQVEIDPSERAWSGGIYDESRRGWLNSLKDNNAARYAFKQNDWNHYRIVAIGDRIRTWINGVPAADLKDNMTPNGFIALQVHGVGGRKDPIQVMWKNIRLRENPEWKEEAKSQEDKSPEKIFSRLAAIRKIARGYKFTEGPAVGPGQAIYFNDIPNQVTHILAKGSDQVEVFRKNTGRANGMFWTANDKLVVCEGGNRRVTMIDGDKVQVLASQFEGKKLNSPNDVALDTVGGLYFTDPRYGNRDDMELSKEAVYYVNRGGKISRVIDNLKRPNGLIFSPDFKVLYVADQAGSKIMAYDVKGDGKLSEGRKISDFGSDGMSVDVYGNIYLTWKGAVIVLDSTGKEIDRLKFPESPANCVLVGSTLYVTARTGFYSVETLSKGVQ